MKRYFIIATILVLCTLTPCVAGSTEQSSVSPISENCSPAGINLIKSFEGFRSKAYRCPAGVYTIGYGSTRGVRAGMVITRERGEQLLKRDLIRYENIVKRKINRPLKWHEFDALTSFSYNLGDRFKGELREYLNAGDMVKAAMKMKLYCKARVGGKLTVLRGLQRRRQVEVAFLLFQEHRMKSYYPKDWQPVK